MIAEGQIKSAFIEPMVAAGHEYLAEDRIRKLAERPEGHFFVRPVLGFFKAYSPDRLLDELQAELRRDRRRFLLNLLEVHGAPRAWRRGTGCRATPTGALPGSTSCATSCTCCASIPRAADTPWLYDEEIDAIAPLVRPGQPLFLVKEALQYLVATRQPRAEGHLLAQFDALEQAVGERPTSDESRPGLLIQLDRTAGALARFASPATWAALVEHALGRQVGFGDTLARLAELSGQDLSPAPDVVSRLVDAVDESLPHGVLGRLVPGREAVVSRLIAALASTRSKQARELLEHVASRFASQAFGREAQSALLALDRTTDPSASTPTFSGDLGLFGLPNLLQNLSELGKTGVLNLLDAQGRPAASLRLEEGAIIGAQCGTRHGREAVFQLIERPFPATFAFVRGKRPEPGDGEKLPVTHLLIEGVRRHGELQRALALVPEDALLEATATPPTSVPDEDDYDLVVAAWQKVCAGETPHAVEATLTADSYRLYHALAHWVEEGSLRLRSAAAA